MTSQHQIRVFLSLFLLTCYILITRVYECLLPCMYNDVCNSDCGSQLLNKVDTYLLTQNLFFSWGLAHWQRFWTVNPTRSAIQMLKYNTILYKLSNVK